MNESEIYQPGDVLMFARSTLNGKVASELHSIYVPINSRAIVQKDNGKHIEIQISNNPDFPTIPSPAVRHRAARENELVVIDSYFRRGLLRRASESERRE